MRKATDLERFFIKTAVNLSEMSYAVRKKVGAVIVKDGRIISTGYNGTPDGFDKCCEYEEANGTLRTKDTVVHAETNAILFAAKNGIALDNAEIFLSLSPCAKCAVNIIQAGIKKVYFLEEYTDTSGIEILKDHNLPIEQLEI